MNSENKYISDIIMSKKILGEIAYLKRMSKNVTAGESRERVNELIELYSKRKITQATTVEKIIKAYIGTKTAKQREAVNLKYDAIVAKYKEAQSLSERLATKKAEKEVSSGRGAAARKIQKTMRGIVKFKTTVLEKSMKANVLRIGVESTSIGSAMSTQIEAFVARAYLMARRQLPKNAVFKVWASCAFKYDTPTGYDKTLAKKTRTHDSDKINEFYQDFITLLMLEYCSIKLSTLKFEFNFLLIPAGGARSKDRSLESVYSKTSVLQIVNDDNNCFWYAMASLMNPKNKLIRDARYPNTRIKIGKEICAKTGYEWDKPFPLHLITFVEEKYKCNIYIINVSDIPMLGSTVSLLMNCLMYKSLNRGGEHYYLLYDEDAGHYDCITDIKKFMAVREFCHTCLKGFTNKSTFDNHTCEECMKPRKVNKKTAGKLLKDLAHYLDIGICKGSCEEIAGKQILKNPSKIIDQIQHPKYITFDFETDTHTGVHRANHVEIDVLKIGEKDNHNYDDCLIKSFGFNGYDCATKFCDWLFTDANRNSTVIAHNGAGYDNKFILQYCLGKGLLPSTFIRQGSKITYMNFKGLAIRFVDSYCFFSEPLKNLSDTFNIDTIKGYFPHHFNRPENQNYIGKIPNEAAYGCKNMLPKAYDEIVKDKERNIKTYVNDRGETKILRKGFLPWYEEQQEITDWNFKTELIKYCRADVELLSKAVLKFRHEFKVELDIDPWRYVTLASLSMAIYIGRFLPKKTIVGNGSEKKDSLVAREWLTHLNNVDIVREVPIMIENSSGCDIHKNKVGDKQKEYFDLKRPFTVDGLDIETFTAYQFQGCYWHGCRKCHPEHEVRYNKTMETVNYLENDGYNVVQMWECDWKNIKAGMDLDVKLDLETQAKHQTINPRDAFFGGRTEGFKTYHKCSETEKIYYYDIVSLYPTVNALDEYAVGFSSYVNNLKIEDIENGKFIGVAKVDISPPKNQLIPVLPDNSNGKLLFHSNKMVGKTFTSVELRYALSLGYEINWIYSAKQYRKYTGLMKKYVEFFLKIKINNEQFYSEEECDKINKSHREMGLDITIKSENTCKNPGKRAIAKLCLNSLWGKFGQRTTLDSYEYITDWNKLLLKITDKDIKTKDWHIINDSCVELRYNNDINHDVEPEFGSEITAAFTTANARIRLMSMLRWLDYSQIVYCDTDSVMFIYDSKNPKHKSPSNLEPKLSGLPNNVRFGEALGNWKNEFKPDEWIVEIVVGGAKSYSFITNLGNIVIKQKGITLDRANCNKFTFENIRNVVLKNLTITSEPRFSFRMVEKTKDIITVDLSRTARLTVDTKRNIHADYSTTPYGYNPA